MQSRVSGTHPEDYFDWLYKKRKGIEYYDKELCILPLEDLKYCSAWYAAGDGSRTGSFLIEHKKELRLLLKRITVKGQISSLQLLDSRVIDIWWGPVHWGKGALDSLWRSGQIVISERKSGKKYYHLPQAVYGKLFQAPAAAGTGKRFEERILRRVNAVGMLPKSGSGTGWLGMGKSKEIAAIIGRLLEKGFLIEVEVAGRKHSVAAMPKAKRVQ